MASIGTQTQDTETDSLGIVATKSSCTSEQVRLEAGKDGSKAVDTDTVWARRIGKRVNPPMAEVGPWVRKLTVNLHQLGRMII